MGCQKMIVKEIADQGANYVLALEANHTNLREEVSKHFTPLVDDTDSETTKALCEGTSSKPKNTTWSCHVAADCSHGKIVEGGISKVLTFP